MRGHELTTLELAERIATAVLGSIDSLSERSDDLANDPPTQAVIRVLFESDSWFSRIHDPDDGPTTEEPYEQLDLFQRGNR